MLLTISGRTLNLGFEGGVRARCLLLMPRAKVPLCIHPLFCSTKWVAPDLENPRYLQQLGAREQRTSHSLQRTAFRGFYHTLRNTAAPTEWQDHPHTGPKILFDCSIIPLPALPMTAMAMLCLPGHTPCYTLLTGVEPRQKSQRSSRLASHRQNRHGGFPLLHIVSYSRQCGGDEMKPGD